MTTDTGERAHVDKAGVVAVALPFAEAMPLFTPEGRAAVGGGVGSALRASGLARCGRGRRVPDHQQG